MLRINKNQLFDFSSILNRVKAFSNIKKNPRNIIKIDNIIKNLNKPKKSIL